MLVEKFVNDALRIIDNQQEYSLEFLFIEDGSVDNTLQVLKSLSVRKKNVCYISLKNPFGQGIALAIGIVKSSADAVVSIDIDGSHPLEVVKSMIEKYLEGYDVVQGVRVEYKRNSLYRAVGSKIYFLLFRMMTGINLGRQNVHFRLMSDKACKIVRSNQTWWYSLRTKFRNSDHLRIAYIPFTAPERTIGNSKFHFRRLFIFAWNSFLTLTSPPMFLVLVIIGLILLYFFSYINTCLAVIGLLLLIPIIPIYYLKRNRDYLCLIKENRTSDE
jgi:polyisoprenyl-phosphate glycosyltransferase